MSESETLSLRVSAALFPPSVTVALHALAMMVLDIEPLTLLWIAGFVTSVFLGLILGVLFVTYFGPDTGVRTEQRTNIP